MKKYKIDKKSGQIMGNCETCGEYESLERLELVDGSKGELVCPECWKATYQ